MALLLDSVPQNGKCAAPASVGAKPEEKRGTRIETRVHQRQCVKCRRWFWAWDPDRLRCFVCDAPPPKELKRILERINGRED
jgi:hypothetical protein